MRTRRFGPGVRHHPPQAGAAAARAEQRFSSPTGSSLPPSRAGAAAGDRQVAISGGASVVQQAIIAGLLDELHLHLAPVMLGGGTRLFDSLLPGVVELDRFRLTDSSGLTPGLTHLSFRFPTAGEDQ